jgi:hypothetical protein
VSLSSTHLECRRKDKLVNHVTGKYNEIVLLLQARRFLSIALFYSLSNNVREHLSPHVINDFDIVVIYVCIYIYIYMIVFRSFSHFNRKDKTSSFVEKSIAIRHKETNGRIHVN